MSKQEINISGTVYLLDIDRAKELGVLVDKPENYSIGQRFHQVFGNATYILANTDGVQFPAPKKHVMLIDINRGNRWNGGSTVKDVQNITPEEFDAIAGGDEDFTLINP